MNTRALFVHDVFASARVLALGGGIVLLTACNSAPSRSNTADAINAGAAGDPVAAGSSATVAPNNDRQTPIRDEFDPGTPDAGEVAAIQRIAPGADPRAAIKSYLETLQTASERPVRSAARVLFVAEPGYEQVFPGRLFYAVRFPQWPVAVAPLPPLAANNLFVFENAKPLQLLTGSQQLQQYFSQAAAKRSGEDAAKHVLAAWLILYAELAQDGLFQFAAPNIESVAKTASNTVEAKGRISVEPRSGDSGEIRARIIVDANGKLLSAHTEHSLQAGIRPICQATKLLDPDPLVRRMAERDLLVMGRSARDYLFRQRSQAAPELRARIDRLWRQILEEHR